MRAAPVFQETGFAVADGPIGTYFAARGGVRTFGPPVSNAFPLLGATVQIFRDHVLKVEPNGAVSTVNLFAMGAIPFRNVGGRIIPDVDPYLVATAPVPGTPDYAARVQAFIQETAPDQWEGMPVGFYKAFLGHRPRRGGVPERRRDGAPAAASARRSGASRSAARCATLRIRTSCCCAGSAA